jgi:hypothetical protein
MNHRHEAHKSTGRAPLQVEDPIPDDHLVLAVDGTFALLEALGVFQ